MKLLLGFLTGILLGAACGLGLIYFNPLIGNAPAPDVAGTEPLRYSLNGPHLLASTHNDLLPLPVAPSNAPLLWESGIRGSWLEVLVLEDGTGVPGGIATRLSVPSARSNAVSAGLITDDHWLITVPGRGLLYAHGRSNVWPALKDTVVGVDLLGRKWAGSKRYDLAARPARNGAEVLGLSGEFAGYHGNLNEILEIDGYPEPGFGGLKAEVRLDLIEPEAASLQENAGD